MKHHSSSPSKKEKKKPQTNHKTLKNDNTKNFT